MSVIGERVRRLEDPRLVRGGGRYVSDLRLDALHVGFVRSPHAHARIESVSLDAARSLPEVVAAYAAADLPELSKRVESEDTPGARGYYPLATDTVRYVGEPVAVVLATSAAALEDALEKVDISYDPLPAVVDPEAALEGGALVWDDRPGNVVLEMSFGFGDVEAAFRDADAVVEYSFTFERSAAASLETRAVAALPGEGEVRLHLQDSTQAPHHIRAALARYFDLPEQAVRVTVPDVGGGFGPKGRTYPEEIVLAALAMRQGRAVRWVSTRSEDLATTGQGRGQIHHARLAAREDGTILAVEDRVINDAGAYTPNGMGIVFNTVRHLMGPYRLPALSAHVVGAFTNKTVSSALRGGGRPEGVFMVERLLDRLATHLGLDPLEVRRRNIIPPDAFPYDTGLRMGGRPVVYDSGDFPGYLAATADAIGYDSFRARQAEARKRGEYLGLGLGLLIESTGVGTEGGRARLDTDGVLHVSVGSPSTGQGHATVFAQIAAEGMGVPIEDVRVESGDTERDPEGTGTFASRMTFDGGNAVASAVTALREEVLERAGMMLEASPADLTIENGRVSVRGYRERMVSLAEVAAAAEAKGQDLAAQIEFAPEHGSAWAGAANAAIVRVDVETGLVSIERYVVVHDSGILINPALVEGQVQGGVVHGIGNVLFEACIYGPDGQYLSGSFADYALPQFDNVPAVEIHHVETPSPFSRLGVKGAGESGTIGALPTLIGAIEDALAPFSIRLDRMPVTPETIALAVAGRSTASATS
jgi:carbon-monoxide dehydrogenase large subunit